jgi:hypothetical protein
VTLLLRLCAVLPVGGPAFRLHLLAPCAMALAGTLLFTAARRVAGGWAALAATAWAMTLPAALAQGVEVKSAVYGLHLAAVAAVVGLLAARPPGWAPGILLVCGLAGANHVHGAAVLGLAAGAAVLAGAPRRGPAAVMLLLGGSVMLYVPLRAAAHPPVCWGRVDHAAGWIAAWRWAAGMFHDYNTRLAAGDWARWGRPLLVPAGIAVAGFGLGTARGPFRAPLAVAAVATLVPFALFIRRDLGVGAIQYALPVCLGAGLGLAAILAALRPRTAPLRAAAILVALGAAVRSAAAPGPADRSRFYALDDHVRNTVAALPPGGPLLVWLGDYDYDAARYRQLVLGERPDVMHVHGPILLTPAYGDHLAFLAAARPALRLPAARSAANPAALDRVLADLIRLNRDRMPVDAPAYFLEEDWTWPGLKALHPAVAGGLAAFGRDRVRDVPPSRQRTRGLAGPGLDADRWAAGLRRQVARSLAAGLDGGPAGRRYVESLDRRTP